MIIKEGINNNTYPLFLFFKQYQDYFLLEIILNFAGEIPTLFLKAFRLLNKKYHQQCIKQT